MRSTFLLGTDSTTNSYHCYPPFRFPFFPPPLYMSLESSTFFGAGSKLGNSSYAVLELENGSFELTDSMEKILMGEQRLTCRASVRDGKIWWQDGNQ